MKPLRDLVLVGGGHTHVQVLKAFAMEPPEATRLTVVLDRPVAVYSGMVPGFVAGQYSAPELEIDVVPLARRAGARVVLAAATAVDPEARRISVEGRPPVRYDLASVDVGSTVAGLELPGIRQHAVPTRPISLFVRRIDAALAEARRERAGRPLRVVVAGGGVGGVELAFTLYHRLAAAGVEPRVTLVHGGERLLPGMPAGLVRRVERHAAAAGIEVVCGRRVTAAEADAVVLAGKERVACDLLLWVTGAASSPLWRRSGLPTDERGFVLTRPTLQVEGHDDLFAVGDCATLAEHPETPKAGVYAVRQGPYLIDNLRAALDGGKLRRYRPQGDFLSLLNLGDGTALGSKKGISFEGRWVMRLKDLIDRRFMRRFQVLEPAGALTETFAAEPAMGDGGEMLCGGCAAKVGQTVLERALERLAQWELPAAETLGAPADEPTPIEVVLGLGEADDAVAVATPKGEVVVASLDAFRAFTDDAWTVGRVAAVNALSDLAAMGVEPAWAQALVALPEDEAPEQAEETLFQVLAGARAAFAPLGIAMLGGHTTTAPALMVGFTVEGLAQNRQLPLTLAGLAAGQVLLLTKALGTGVLFNADMQGRARGPWIEAALAAMVRPNVAAALIARRLGATAATDVTGFGLAGHLAAMLRRSGVSATLDLDTLPALPGAVELFAQGIRSTFHPANETLRKGLRIDGSAAGHPRLPLLFDPQTSGGLLFGLDAARADEALDRLHQAGDTAAAAIGRLEPPRADGAPIEVTAPTTRLPRPSGESGP